MALPKDFTFTDYDPYNFADRRHIGPSPAEMAEIAAALPNGRFVEIPTAGHMTPLENPGDVNAALAAFLDELP